MSKKALIEEEIQRTLAEFDTAKQIKADAFFYTTLKARLDERSKSLSGQDRKSYLPRLRPVFIFLLLFLNLTAGILFIRANQGQRTIRNNYIASVAEEFSLTGSEGAFEF